MRLTENIEVVGGGWLGFGLSHRSDCHIYLVHDAGEGILIDAGVGLGTPAVLSLVEAAGIESSRVRRVLLTHAHADHAGGAASLAAATGASVHGSAATARILADGDDEAAGLNSAKLAGLYPPEVTIHRTSVQTCHDGDTFTVGRLGLRAIDAPGHARGHLAFALMEDDAAVAVFTGDLVFARGRLAVLPAHDTSFPDFTNSLTRIRALGAGMLLPGHGSVAMSDATDHLDEAIGRLAVGRMPEPLT